MWNLDGVMFNKDIIHPQMRRKVENPRVILLDYIKKENSKQILNLQKTHDFSATLEEERKEVKALCDQLIELKPDVVVTEKETSDLATHYLQNVNVSVIRLLTKTDNNLLAKVIGAVIENRLEELQESDVGTIWNKKNRRWILFIFYKKQRTKSSPILLREASKDVLYGINRNLDDVMTVARNILYEPKLVPGVGALKWK